MWNGAFQPNLTKRVGSVKFVPLDEMTNFDWNWLDYYNLRNRAKNRLAKVIVAGLVGFKDVRLDEGQLIIVPTGRSKPRYLYGATAADEAAFEENGHDFFKPEADTEDVEAETDMVDDAISEMSFYRRFQVVTALLQIFSELDADDRIDRAVRALKKSEALSEPNFLLLAAVCIGIATTVAKVSYVDMTARLISLMDSSSNQIAAGRGL